MSITFQVIDLSCEQSDQSFFVPQVRIQAKSTTQYATLHGYSEFVASVPPKKYRRIDVSGTSERIGFTCEETPRQCAGAKYTWSGFGEFDLKGVQTASYSKKFYAQCTKQYWPVVPNQNNPDAIGPSPTPIYPQHFVGYCWPQDLNSCPVCDPNIVNWPLIGDMTTNVPQVDLQGFLRPSNGVVATSTSLSVSGQVFGIFAMFSPPHNATVAGVPYNVNVGGVNHIASAAITDPPLAFPAVYVDGFEGAWVNFVDANSYSATLSEEYTDADALANATVVTGTGATASTTPRTTGFVSVFTSVVFTIFTSNLIPGKDYVVTVDLWEKGPGVNTHTPKSYGFTAAASTHTITDVVPTPADFHTITVQKPTITFAPP